MVERDADRNGRRFAGHAHRLMRRAAKAHDEQWAPMRAATKIPVSLRPTVPLEPCASTNRRDRVSSAMDATTEELQHLLSDSRVVFSMCAMS